MLPQPSLWYNSLVTLANAPSATLRERQQPPRGGVAGVIAFRGIDLEPTRAPAGVAGQEVRGCMASLPAPTSPAIAAGSSPSAMRGLGHSSAACRSCARGAAFRRRRICRPALAAQPLQAASVGSAWQPGGALTACELRGIRPRESSRVPQTGRSRHRCARLRVHTADRGAASTGRWDRGR
jgi:hypothetical protein